MFTKNEKGQAAIILAFAVIALLAFAALAIDAGNAYTERREAQNAADAAAMAGARELVLQCGTAAPNDQAIYDAAEALVNANIQGATFDIRYVDAAGNLSEDTVGQTGIVPCGCGSRAEGVDVTVNGVAQSFIAGLIGRPTLNVQASARARFGAVATAGDLYPITRRMPTSMDDPMFQYGQPVTLRVLDNADTLPGNFGWLTWDGQNNTPALCDSLDDTPNSEIYYNPGFPSAWTPDYNDHAIAVGKWVQGAPGNKNAHCVRSWLDWHIAHGTAMTIPLYDQVAEQGSHGNYRVAGFAAFRPLSYDFTGQNKSMTGMFLRWVTNGDWATGTTCVSEGGVYSVRLVAR